MQPNKSASIRTNTRQFWLPFNFLKVNWAFPLLMPGHKLVRALASGIIYSGMIGIRDIVRLKAYQRVKVRRTTDISMYSTHSFVLRCDLYEWKTRGARPWTPYLVMSPGEAGTSHPYGWRFGLLYSTIFYRPYSRINRLTT